MSIKMLVMDVDGTLTDGKIYIGAQGELMKAFSIKDVYGIVQFIRAGKIPVIITGRQSEIVRMRAMELGITELYQGVPDKLKQLKRVAEKYGFTPEEIAYIGDDLNDLPCMEYCGLTACPSDAVEQVRSMVDYPCNNSGGDGAVREFLDWLCTENNKDAYPNTEKITV